MSKFSDEVESEYATAKQFKSDQWKAIGGVLVICLILLGVGYLIIR